MAELGARVSTPAPPHAGTALLPGRDVDLKQVVRNGLLAGLSVCFVATIGMLVAFEQRVIVSTFTLDYVILVAIPMLFGSLAGKPPQQLEGFAPSPKGLRNIWAGALAGAIGGAEVGVYLALVGNFNVRQQLINVSPEMIGRLTFQQGLFVGWLLLMAGGIALSALGASFGLLRDRIRRALTDALLWVVVFGLLHVVVSSILTKLGFPFTDWLYTLSGSLSITGAIVVFAVMFAVHYASRGKGAVIRERVNDLPPRERKFATVALVVILAVALLVLPNLLTSDLAEDLNLAGIFMLMALGLNLVVGVAGLLDLGYVAFFAVGAYATAILTSPLSPKWAPAMTFFEAIIFVVVAAALAGAIVGVPVLRMRGDYLAIVTLGFGEIARLLVTSTWLTPYFGGALGIIRIQSVHVGGIEFLGSNSQRFFYLIYAFVIIAGYVSFSMQGSRLGRAWMAIREDESVAEAMGVNIVSAKLWAFIIGAVIASFGGALFAVKTGSVFPNSFDIIVSITVLAIVIVGGMGSIPGVVLAAVALRALPEVLQEFQQFRFLIYGGLLIFMMLKRPEGFIPSRRRARELHEDEVQQDAWLREQHGEPVGTEPA